MYQMTCGLEFIYNFMLMAKYQDDIKLIDKKIKNKYITKICTDWYTVIDGKKLKMNSNISINECIFIHKLIMSTKPSKVLEFGMANGMSTMIILNALNIVNKENEAVLYSNDPFQKTYWSSIGLHNVSKVKKNVKHVHLERMSVDSFDDIESNFFDMILVDGAHDTPNVILDINNSKRMLKKNGILILDDVLHTGVRDAIKEVMVNDPHYKRINMIPKHKRHEAKKLEDTYYNPKTMYAYVKK